MVMTNLLENSVARVDEIKNQEYLDFQARRLVEMAGHIIMGYILIIDASRNEMFRKSAEVYLNYSEVEVRKHAAFIKTFNVESLDRYRMAWYNIPYLKKTLEFRFQRFFYFHRALHASNYDTRSKLRFETGLNEYLLPESSLYYLKSIFDYL